MGPGGFTISVATIGLGITLVTDLIRRTLDRNDRAPSWVWTVVPIAIGIGVALAVGLDLAPSSINIAGRVRHVGFWQGCVLTGVALAGAAAGHHSWLDWLSTSKVARAQTSYAAYVASTAAEPVQDTGADPAIPEDVPA